MCISTSTLEGKPSSRMVLLKDYTDDGFTFFTNYSSKKGQELAANPQCSLLFYWDVMSRQIRIDGTVTKVSREKSIEYFSKRPLNSRISAYISDQSKVIKDKQYLIDLQQKATKEFAAENNVPCPENWGGYLIVPHEIEFWQGIFHFIIKINLIIKNKFYLNYYKLGNDIRLHDRILFSKKPFTDPNTQIEGEKGWIIERLAP